VRRSQFAKAMSWSRPLPKLIVLWDGRELKTLADARALILTLPVRHQAKQHWEYASELLMAAAQGDAFFIREFFAQLKRALKEED